jgi:hypothetical protein
MRTTAKKNVDTNVFKIDTSSIFQLFMSNKNKNNVIE